MANILQNAIGTLTGVLRSATAVSITYSRGVTSLVIKATPGNTLTDSQFADGSVRTMRSADFLIETDDMVGLIPTQGDQIAWGTRKFEVRHPAGGRAYDEVGPFGQMYRVHTVEVNAS